MDKSLDDDILSIMEQEKLYPTVVDTNTDTISTTTSDEYDDEIYTLIRKTTTSTIVSIHYVSVYTVLLTTLSLHVYIL